MDASAAIGTHFPATYLGLHLEPHQSNTPSCNTQWQVSTNTLHHHSQTRYSLLTVAALMLLVLLVIFTLLGEDLLLGAARSVPLLPDQVEHSLSHPRVLGEHQL